MLGPVYPCVSCWCCRSCLNVFFNWKRRYSSTVKLLNRCALFGVWWSSIGIEEGQQYKFGQQVFNVTTLFLFCSKTCHDVEGATGGNPAQLLLSLVYARR